MHPAMNREILNTAILAASFLAVFGFAELGYHYFKFPAEATRKFVHITSGLLTLLFPLLIGNQWYVLFLCASFAVILIISMSTGLLPSINNVGRQTFGSLIYPAAVFGCYLVYNHRGNLIYFYLPILILAFCDPLAALAGRRWGKRKYRIGNETKSFEGSLAFFLGACLISMILFKTMSDFALISVVLCSLIVAFFSALAEGLSRKGLDNITIPGIVLILMLFLFGV
jgi:phytol kinase